MDNKNMRYNNTKYEYVEWTTWDGKKCSGYHCEDKALLKGLNTESFGTKTEVEMHKEIDNYIYNRNLVLRSQKLYDDAECEFMEKYGTGALELAIEQGFDKEELLKSLNIHICKINPT